MGGRFKLKVKSMQKALIFILSVSMILSTLVIPAAAEGEGNSSAWNGVTTDTSWYDNNDTVFVITTAEELAGFATLVNGGNTFEGKTVKLGNSIALDADGEYGSNDDIRYGSALWAIITTQYYIKSGANIWTPIGAGTATSNTVLSASTPFAGTFDGQGHTVSGIYTGTTDPSAANTATVQGLFGVVTGTVKNVTTSGCITGKAVLGGVVAYLNGGTVENCTNNAIVFGDGGTTPNGGAEDGTSSLGAIGGIAGNAMTDSAITGCVNNADITCANSASGGRTGGILGLINGSTYVVTVKDCLNHGDVDSYQYAGGIVGGNWSTISPIENCGNTGTITGFAGTTYVGGIAAYTVSDISNCYNTGTFSIYIGGSSSTKAARAGGIVSYLGSSAVVTNCYNTGVFISAGNANSRSTSLGGICGTGYGSSTANKLINCYTVELIGGNNSDYFEDLLASCAILKTSADMKTADFLTDLNGTDDAFAADTNEINDGYPILAFQVAEPSAETDWYAVTSFEDGQTYYISSATDLVAMSALVNAGHSGANSAFVLTEDIDLNDIDFTPIGTVTVATGTELGAYTLGNPFAGVFDGDGHTISNLSLEDANGGVALFAYSSGTIQNLTVTGDVTGNHFTAGVVALGSGVIENVTNQVSVYGEGNCIGGIVADAVGDLTITGCFNEGKISNGAADSARSTGRVAGIVGRIESGYTASITECANLASVTGYQYVGGIIGGSFGKVTIDACYNSGKITGISFGKVYLGGIAGKLESGTISNCYNTGDLYDAHWSGGHIRAVGGIVGCEENHTLGTAVTNCYNTGTMTFNTSNMISGSNYIHMTGNISGGNNASDSNTMSYENCFYLDGALTIANPDNAGYVFWSDVYKNNPLAYDTADITGCTAAELMSASVLNDLGGAFAADTDSINGGYPVLYWQMGNEAPVVTSGITVSVAGGTAAVTAASSAEAGTEVSVSVTNIEAGKQLKAVTAVDASGAKLTVTERDGSYVFTMPARAVTVTITLENEVTSGNTHALTLPSGLDAIWNVSVDSTYYSGGRVNEGASVTIVVSKEDGAVTTSFSGVTVKGESQAAVATVESGVKTVSGARTYAEYTFTMPAYDVTVSLEETYSDLTVNIKNPDGSSEAVKAYSRAEMEGLAESASVSYSGWSSETEALIGRADTAISLLELLEDAGLTFASGDSLVVTAADGMSLTYTYDDLIGTERFYYADIFENGNAATQKTARTPILVLKGNIALSSGELDSMVTDTLNTYRFIYGQSEAELTNNVKCVDTMPKCVTSITVVKAETENPDTYTVSVTTYPKRADVTVYDSDGTMITANADGSYDLADGTYTYTATMPGYKDATGSFTVENGVLKGLETITLTADVNLGVFIDVNTSLWYKNAVEYSVANNLFTGTSATTWEPDTALSRAMFVTVLGKYEGVSNTDYSTCEFNDVADGQWYTGFVQWAYNEGLVAGTGGGNFSPNDSITRQEMAVIFYKYAASKGCDMTASAGAFSGFPDKDEADSWAVTALTWATDRGIINGSDGKLMPKDTATRAQAAQIFMRIIEDIL